MISVSVIVAEVTQPFLGVGYELGRAVALNKRFFCLRLSDSVWFSVSVSVIVAEVTQPSFAVGYELGQAVALNKRVFCLFRPSSGKGIETLSHIECDPGFGRFYDSPRNMDIFHLLPSSAVCHDPQIIHKLALPSPGLHRG